MRISDWSSDVCSSDLCVAASIEEPRFVLLGLSQGGALGIAYALRHPERVSHLVLLNAYAQGRRVRAQTERSEEHTSELQSLMRISYAVFCLKKKKLCRIRQYIHHYYAY